LRSQVRLTGSSALDPGRDLMTPAADSVDAYVTSGLQASLVDRYSFAQGTTPNVTLRAYDAFPFSDYGATTVMPPAVIGVDLLESSDPREHAAGRRILEGLLL